MFTLILQNKKNAIVIFWVSSMIFLKVCPYNCVLGSTGGGGGKGGGRGQVVNSYNLNKLECGAGVCPSASEK